MHKIFAPETKISKTLNLETKMSKIGLFTVPYYGYGRTIYGYNTGLVARTPYRIGRLQTARRYGTGKNTGIRLYLRVIYHLFNKIPSQLHLNISKQCLNMNNN